jgi:hypothetical protein
MDLKAAEVDRARDDHLLDGVASAGIAWDGILGREKAHARLLEMVLSASV